MPTKKPENPEHIAIDEPIEVKVNRIRLKDVYKSKNSMTFLYDMLLERTDPKVNISHQRMPTFEEHTAFYASKPYKHWWQVRYKQKVVGVAYLTKQNEIGVFLKKKYQGKRLGRAIIWRILLDFPQSYFLANINPRNDRSIKLFTSIGFKHIQNTYKLDLKSLDINEFNRISAYYHDSEFKQLLDRKEDPS